MDGAMPLRLCWEGRKEGNWNNSSVRIIECKHVSPLFGILVLCTHVHTGIAQLFLSRRHKSLVEKKKSKTVLFQTLSTISHTLFFSISREILRPSVLACLQGQQTHVQTTKQAYIKLEVPYLSPGVVRGTSSPSSSSSCSKAGCADLIG
jgi:hypothetical protein